MSVGSWPGRRRSTPRSRPTVAATTIVVGAVIYCPAALDREAAHYEIATAALGLLTATYHDDHHFGEGTFEYLAAVGNETKKVIRLTTGMTALRLIPGNQHEVWVAARCLRVQWNRIRRA